MLTAKDIFADFIVPLFLSTQLQGLKHFSSYDRENMSSQPDSLIMNGTLPQSHS